MRIKKLAATAGVALVAIISIFRPCEADVTLSTDRDAFVADTGATAVPFPPTDQSDPITFEGVTITTHGAAVYDVPPLGPADPTNPPLSSGIVTAHGEDDLLLTFDPAVNAVGLGIVTNFAAQETVTVKDEAGTILFQGSLDNLTMPNSLAFIGFASSVPIKSLLLDTTGGASQNEAIFEILTDSTKPVSCETDLAQCEADLTECLTNPVIPDQDGDGEPDATDACPNTPVDAPVDQAGCSLAQFCAAIDATTAQGAKVCEQSDWRNDEPLMKAKEADCRVEKGGPRREDDRCVAKDNS